MPQISCRSRRVAPAALTRFCADLLAAAGVRRAPATLVSRSLVEANLRGIDSHGVARLPHYLDRMACGSVNPRPAIRFHGLNKATGRVDGDHGLGQLAMHRAALEAIKLAHATGAGWVSVSNSSHCGSLSFYGLRIAQAGMIGLVFTHSDSMVLPYGANAPFCGTNPICITAPGQGSARLCLDMATSVAPWNSIVNALMEGLGIPRGWAVDAEGRDTTNPKKVNAVYPFGQYKGSGLGLMIEVLCALLGPGPYGPDISKMYGDLEQRRLLGGLVGALDIRGFVELRQFRARVSELMRRWNALPPRPPQGQVLYPGQPEEITRTERLAKGIPLGLELIQIFRRLAHQYGVDFPFNKKTKH